MRDSACPETGARHLLAVRFAGDSIRQPGHSARMLRSVAAGEARDGEVEAAPPEMDGTRFSFKAGTEMLERRHDRRKRFPEPACRVAVVVAWCRVLSERDRFWNLVRTAIEARRKAVQVEHRDEPPMEGCNASRIQRKLLTRFVARPQDDRMAAQVEGQREGPAVARRGRQGG